MTKINVDDFLLEVERPARYTNNEYNSIHKDWTATEIKVALAFPDIYEIGMSNLGLKILYYIINSRPDTLAERVYSPWVDMEKALTSRNLPLFSLESKRPLKEFDIIGFSLQYEMSYTNVLNMLKLAQIPLRSSDREEGQYPLIIAGGPCAFAPEPLADFIDVFIIGDAEESILEFIEVYKNNRQIDKPGLLMKLSAIEGVYVPSLYEPVYNDNKTLKELKPKYDSVSRRIKKRVVELEKSPYPDKFIVPNVNIVHNRAVMEVMRGCVRGCRFCQATMIYRPARIRSKETAAKLLEQIMENSGFDEVSFSSLSTSDYPGICSLLSELLEKYEKEKVSFSLPSLRADNFSIGLANLVQQVRKSGLTFAPEAGTARLRNIINKDISDQDLIESVGAAYRSGWRSLKLYFMIGLPFETQEDIEGIVKLVRTLKSLYKGLNFNVNISSFVPKAFSVFQWHNQEKAETMRAKMEYLKKNLPAQVKWHKSELSFLEAVFARGDRRLGRVIEYAVGLGCRFDQWNEHFSYQSWTEAFKKADLDPWFYASRQFSYTDTLPWDHIDAGVTKDFLWNEYQKAIKGESTPDCLNLCSSCGADKCQIGDFKKTTQLVTKFQPSMVSKTILFPMQKIRIKFAKKNDARFISHLDLIVVFKRALRRSKIPLAYSQGFNPHSKMSFGPPLAVGFESDTEFLDIELTKRVELGKIIPNVNKQLPAGLEIVEAQEIPLNSKALMSTIKGAIYQVKVAGQLVEDLPEYVVLVKQVDSLSELTMKLPLGEKNIRPDRICKEVFANGCKIKQIKRTEFLFGSLNE